MIEPDLPALARALAALPGFAAIAPDDLQPLPRKGLAHMHWRIANAAAVLRVPVRLAPGDAAETQLARQVAGFGRAAASGHVPRLIAVVPPSAEMPLGALVVEAIAGRAPHLPADAPAIAEALAAVHGIMLPAPRARAPLADPTDSFAATLAQIERLAAEAGGAELAPAAARAIEDELAWARSHARRPHAPPPKALILTDTHAGNFIVRDDGRAVFVDLEKVQYGCPAIDVAHTTLRPSARWDPDCDHVWTASEIAAFVAHYLERIGPDREAALRPWLLAFRRLVWLRTTTMYWRRLSRHEFTDALAPDVARHVQAIVADALAPAAIAAVRGEWLGASDS